MTKVVLLVVALLMLVFPAAAQDQTVPRFEPADCQFFVEGNIECGYVVVPAFHDQPDGETIRLSVVVKRGTDPLADPVMLLSGGPGEKTTATASFALSGNFAALSGGMRDFILFDQRGVGLSEPALECPEYANTLLAWLERDSDPEGAAQAVFDAVLACRERLVSEGIDLAAYNTTQNAADVAAIVQALGYEQVNLVGVSYGSLLAQAVMRDHPEIVRSVTIDSVLPTGRSFFIDTYASVSDSLNRLIGACESDAACSAAYPNLQQVLFDTIDRLNQTPAFMFITDPVSDEGYSTYLTGDGLVSNLSIFLYQASLLPLLPQTIYNVSQGDTELMEQLSGLILPAYNALSRGMTFSVFCADDIIGRTPEDFLAAYEALPPQYRGQVDVEVLIETSIFAICEGWGVPTLDAAIKAPVISAIPTLLLGGEFDPVTPFIYAQEVAQTLDNYYIYEIPATGHSSILSNACAASIAASFIVDPTSEPDSACLAQVAPIAFALPVSTVVEFTPFFDNDMGLRGVIPQGWSEASPGVYTDASMTRALVIQSFGGTMQDAVDLLSAQTGIVPIPAASVMAGSYSWTMYQLSLQGASFDIALTVSGSRVIIVGLQVLPSEREQLYETILLPVIEALQST